MLSFLISRFGIAVFGLAELAELAHPLVVELWFVGFGSKGHDVGCLGFSTRRFG